VLELEAKGPQNPSVAEGLDGLLGFYFDLIQVQCARASGEVGRICAELVHGYNQHPAWDDSTRHRCFNANDLQSLESLIPGISSTAWGVADGVDPGAEQRPQKAGPCVQNDGLKTFTHLRMRLDGCLTGSRLSKDRAAEALTKVMIPEALDYPG